MMWSNSFCAASSTFAVSSRTARSSAVSVPRPSRRPELSPQPPAHSPQPAAHARTAEQHYAGDADWAAIGELKAAVDPHRIGIRFGDFYARRLIDALGLVAQDGVVRVSMVHYNTLDEVDRLIVALDRALTG